MTRFSRLQGRSCRSGGAAGADESFESNVDARLYLPWKGFRGKQGTWQYSQKQLHLADSILLEAFPYELRRRSTVAFFRRNVWQVLGVCDSLSAAVPSDFVVCWTPDGATNLDEYNIETTGGTGVAINIASMFDVQVFNLKRSAHYKELESWCKDRERALDLKFCERSWNHLDEYGVPVHAADLQRRRREAA